MTRNLLKPAAMIPKSRWVITAENCLTGEREVVSLPMERLEAIARCKKHIRDNAMDPCRAFKNLRIEECNNKQLTIW